MPVTPVHGVQNRRGRFQRCCGVAKQGDGPFETGQVDRILREDPQMLRFWLASRLGCKGDLLIERLTSDPLGSEFFIRK
jgi:hypothetical protein